MSKANNNHAEALVPMSDDNHNNTNSKPRVTGKASKSSSVPAAGAAMSGANKGVNSGQAGGQGGGGQATAVSELISYQVNSPQKINYYIAYFNAMRFLFLGDDGGPKLSRGQKDWIGQFRGAAIGEEFV